MIKSQCWRERDQDSRQTSQASPARVSSTKSIQKLQTLPPKAVVTRVLHPSQPRSWGVCHTGAGSGGLPVSSTSQPSQLGVSGWVLVSTAGQQAHFTLMMLIALEVPLVLECGYMCLSRTHRFSRVRAAQWEQMMQCGPRLAGSPRHG